MLELVTDSGVHWTLACSQNEVNGSLTQFLEIADLLLEQVQLNSTHLFRADILHDSSGKLETLAQKEAKTHSDNLHEVHRPTPKDAPCFNGFKHDRTVLRKLIPRKPQVDKALDQTCLFYSSISPPGDYMVIYLPHCQSAASMPWYHPIIEGLAYRFSSDTSSSLAIYYLPFPDTPSPIPCRLSRTFTSLLKTMIRLLKLPKKADTNPMPKDNDVTTIPLTASLLKDTVLPQHTVQDTYSRLKQKYASALISKWVESTEPSKHVFEDISIAAFLIELWKAKYGSPETFPGFVDIACGNGVLTYLLLSEGWKGYGFDARARKTWQILKINEALQEKLCIPGPFFNFVNHEEETLRYINGMFSPGTFIISNHADELTCWTPILSALSDPVASLPFLAIPCCSHALDGSKNRYTLNDVHNTKSGSSGTKLSNGDNDNSSHQGHAGDLKALRVEKQKAAEHNDDKSQYACLTRKTAAIAQELGFDVKLTLMRIPSTRNVGILGNCRVHKTNDDKETGACTTALKDRLDQIHGLLERELKRYGGLGNAAKTWIDKAQNLQASKGRGKFRPKVEHVSCSDTEKHIAVDVDRNCYIHH